MSVFLKSKLWKDFSTISASSEEKITSDFLKMIFLGEHVQHLSLDQILAACTYKTWNKHVLIVMPPWHAAQACILYFLFLWAQVSKPGLWTSPLIGCHLQLLAHKLMVPCLYFPFSAPLVPVAPSFSLFPILWKSFCLARVPSQQGSDSCR